MDRLVIGLSSAGAQECLGIRPKLNQSLWFKSYAPLFWFNHQSLVDSLFYRLTNHKQIAS